MADFNVKQFHEEFTKSWNELKRLLEKQQTEIKANKETNTKTGASIKEVTEQLHRLGSDIKELQVKKNRPGFGYEQQMETLGYQFVNSDQYKSMQKDAGYNSNPFRLKSILKRRSKDAQCITTDDDMNIQPFRVPEWFAPADRINHIRDLIPVQNTDNNAIEFVQETGFVNAETGEPTGSNASTVAETNQKPDSTLDFNLETVSVTTIAHHLCVSRQAIDDVNQLQAYIDQRLVYGLALEEDAQLLYGDGSSPNLQGLLAPNSGIQRRLWSEGEVNDTKLDAIRRGITDARLAHYPVTGLVMNPRDWQNIQLIKGDDGHYIWFNVPVANGDMRLWAVPVVESTAIEDGSVLMGGFDLGATIWDRQQAMVRISEHHNDNFTKNLITILAEQRLALAIYRPESFVEVEFDEAPTEE